MQQPISHGVVPEQPSLASLVDADVIRRAAIVALIMGSALTLANQPDAFFGEGAVRILPLLLVFITPFIVVTFSQILGMRRAHLDARGVQTPPLESLAASALSQAIPRRSVAMGVIVGSANTAITVLTALTDGLVLADLPTAPIGQAFVLPMLFSMISQTISYRRVARRIAARHQSEAFESPQPSTKQA
ncbi:MAG: hypothetical protein O3B21_12885 [Proteobacteria bacterium]|nr:hypothetical protein [Pseudomonadota bacterium]MDA1356601.1 hypothetical protein [Pseudomonadota bacterium]